jgi:hypothetical protein
MYILPCQEYIGIYVGAYVETQTDGSDSTQTDVTDGSDSRHTDVTDGIDLRCDKRDKLVKLAVL